MKRLFEIGGIVAGVILVAFGITALVMGFDGRNTVNTSLQQEKIVGSPDMTPAAIAAEAKQAGLKNVSLPTCNVAGKEVNGGDNARCFAQYMRIHTLEATNGLTYAQMGRFLAKDGKGEDGIGGTNVENAAVVDPKSQRPVDNPRRTIWVTETALTTALNVSYMASKLALFSIVIGFAMLLTGIGFLVLAIGGALRGASLAFDFSKKTGKEPHATTA